MDHGSYFEFEKVNGSHGVLNVVRSYETEWVGGKNEKLVHKIGEWVKIDANAHAVGAEQPV